jgi:23S rRNA (uracil1939-C5)-methyltransferase
MSSETLKVGDTVEITTERLTYGGDAIARLNGLAIFVPFAAPDEKLLVRITERKSRFARATIEQIVQPSPSRREPPCKYFGDCGGCQLQHIDYSTQLESKVRFVHDAINRIAQISWPHKIEIRSAKEFGYRGRAQLKIDTRTKKIGFNRAGSIDVCDVGSCPVLVPELEQALHSLRSTLENQTEGNDPRRSQIEIAAGDDRVAFEPAIAGLTGGPIRRTVRQILYSFGPSTFFQGNTELLEALIEEAVGEQSGKLAVDLYAGVGLFTIPLARSFDRVIGVEGNDVASRFAAQNIAENRTINVEFHTSSVESWLKNAIGHKLVSPDLLLLDPPRAGASEALPHLISLQPKRIVYVSCDPATLARDLKSLTAGGYELTRVTAIDLFPQTYHVETIVALERSVR